MNRGGFIVSLIIVGSCPLAASGQDITSNLRAHWKLTETGGTTAVDSSSTANNGTYMNGVLLANGTPVPVDGALAARFDGSNDYVAVPNEALYDGTWVLTVAVWIKVNAVTVNNQAIVSKGENASARLQLAGGSSNVTFICKGLSTEQITSTIGVVDGNWHHVVGVYTGSQLRLYIDGVLNNSVNSSGSISTNNFPVQIGGNAEIAGRHFNGWIYDVRKYDRALSAVDISYLYLQGGPVGHWKLAETSGTSALDSSLYARNGTVFGGANWSTRCNGTRTFDFNGSGHYISIANATQLQPTSRLSIAAWIRGDSWTSADIVNAILRKGEDNPNNYQLCVANGRLSLALDGNDPPTFQGNTPLSTGQWYHVAATWDGSTVRLYVNGQLDNTPASRSGTIGTDTRALYIGGRSGTDFFDGMLHDVRLYNRALSQAEIATAAGWSGHWKFAEGSGTTAADSSGIANNASLSGGATWMTDCAGNKALQTNGAGGIAQTASAVTPPDVGTVAFWMQSNGNPPALGRIFGLGGDWEARQMTDGTLVFDLCGEGNGNFVTTVPLNEVGRWYHVAATFDSASDAYAVYIDGELHNSGINSNGMIKQAAAVLSFGTRTGNTQYWNGAIRDFRVYNRLLCPVEIAELYGLVGYWKLDETSGTTAADSSGFGRDGAVIGTPAWSTGAVDNGLELDGATRVEISSLLGTPKNVTLAAWARLSTADSGGAEVVSLGDYFAIRLDDAAITRAFFYTGSTWTSVSVNQTFARTGWHHFAAVFNDDQNTCKLYIDGTEVASIATTVTIPYTGLGTKTVIGRHGNGTSTMDFTGKVDEVRVYNRALCPVEIQSIHDGADPFEGVRIIKWVEIQ